jgi:hypothetical protein
LAQGTLKKTITVDVKTEQVLLKYDFQQFKRPLGTVRVGIITLLPEFFSLPMTARCFNGGRNAELFQIDQKVNHGQAASAFVSSTASFGATNGSLFMEDTTSTRMLVFTWNPAVCAAIPMLQHQSVQDLHLTRLSFSLCELDDTSQMGGRLIPFTVRLSPA